MNIQEPRLAQENMMARMMSLNGRMQILVRFCLVERLYGLPIEYVDQIAEMVMIVPLPQVNHAVEGVINVRGTFVPVINLRRHLGLPVIPLGLDTHIILVNVGGRKLGLIVDQVVDVFNLMQPLSAPGEILPAGLGELGLLRGLAHTKEGLMFVLDLEQIFDPAKSASLIQAFDVLPELIDAAQVATLGVTQAVEEGT